MRIVAVSGGSYKSFYINCFLKLKKCDLLIFNFGIIYNYVVEDELLKSAIVTKELLQLASKLNATVVAGVFVVSKKRRQKSIIVCDGDKIEIQPANKGVLVCLKKCQFFVGDESANCLRYNKIVLSGKRIRPKIEHCSPKKCYVFCDNYGTTFVQNGKFERKFNKYSKIILK